MNTILQKKNIILNCQPKAKEDVIKEIGKIFYDDGYTTEKYTQAMLDKEKSSIRPSATPSPSLTVSKKANAKSRNRA